MNRRILALGLALALPAGALCAPFLHAHVGEKADHDHSTSVHAHVSRHAPHAAHAGVTVQEPDHDRAIYLQVFVAVQAAPLEVPVAPPALFGIESPPERPAHTAVEVTHGHDPPLVSARYSRPPPPFLS